MHREVYFNLLDEEDSTISMLHSIDSFEMCQHASGASIKHTQHNTEKNIPKICGMLCVVSTQLRKNSIKLKLTSTNKFARTIFSISHQSAILLLIVYLYYLDRLRYTSVYINKCSPEGPTVDKIFVFFNHCR
jgi:hypothetical protein